MRRALVVLAVLLAGCSSGSKPVSVPTATSAAPVASPADPYTALAAPDSPGIGSYDALVSNQAYAASQGFLATQLLEPATLTGTGDKDLISTLAGASGDVAPGRDLGGPKPKEVGLHYRPRFAPGVTLGVAPITVVSSTYNGDEVTGLGGESALRITWTGTIRYHVLVGKAPADVTYGLTFGWVFANDPQNNHLVQLEAVVPGAFTASPVRASCTAKGLLLPGPAAGACPV